jgi:hypothetical protein
MFRGIWPDARKGPHEEPQGPPKAFQPGPWAIGEPDATQGLYGLVGKRGGKPRKRTSDSLGSLEAFGMRGAGPKVTPKAGTVKTGQARPLPVRRIWSRWGFPEFASV